MPEWNEEQGHEEKMAGGMSEAAAAQTDMAQALQKSIADNAQRHREGLLVAERQLRASIARDILCAMIRTGFDRFYLQGMEPVRMFVDVAVDTADLLMQRLGGGKEK